MAKRKDRKSIDYAAFDSIGFDGIKPSVSPRAGSEGLPSPKDMATRRVEKFKPEIDQFALLLQKNEKLERMVLENKRLEAIVQGIPPTISRKTKDKSGSNTVQKKISAR